MKFWVGTTENRWYEFLSERGFDEVNFWQPSARPPFNPEKAPPGLPFLFKLKSPRNHVAGGGVFVTYSALPISVAWDIFGEKNGAASLDELRERLKLLNRNNEDGLIGCSVLTNVVYLPQKNWIPEPPGWAPNIVTGKSYSTETEEGAALWNAYLSNLRYLPDADREQLPGDTSISEKFGQPVFVKPRLGQAAFRILVTDAYKRRCAITGENTLVALEAAHIIPYAKEGTHDVKNGLLLRADFHKLYDVGLVGITPNFRIKISPRIREAYFNGKAYYRLDEQPLAVIPENPTQQPDPDRLDWHMRNKFQA